MFSVEIAAAYPDAKVIILNRDPESWYKSCMSSIYAVSASVPWWHMLLIISCDPLMLKFGLFVIRVRNDVFGFAWPEKEKALAFYDRYHREFREGDRSREDPGIQGSGWMGPAVQASRHRTSPHAS